MSLQTIDELLDAIEVVVEKHPSPLTKAHCEFCTTWLVIMEDILKANE